MWSFARKRLMLSILAALIALSFAGTIPGGRGSTVVAKGPPLTLYIAPGVGSSDLTPIDPMTLADVPDARLLSFPGTYPSWTVSSDGSTLAVTEYPAVGPAIVHFQDPVTQIERNSFELPETASVQWLSRDGSLLIAQTMQNGGATGSSIPDWYVISTVDGSVVSTISGKFSSIDFNSGFHNALYDPNVERLYLPFVQEEKLGDGPLPLNIAGYDIRRGVETGRIELPDVLVGSWFPEGETDPTFDNHALLPGIAVSPDGSRLSVVDPTTFSITIINLSTMQVARELTPYRSVTWRERLANFLSPIPGTAEAKFLNGTALGAYYSPDGAFLYVTGRSAQVGETVHDIKVELLGVQRIILATGEIDAESLDGIDVVNLWVDFGRRALYVYTYDEPWETSTTGVVETHIRRLAPNTLEVKADRELTNQEWVTAVPMSAA